MTAVQSAEPQGLSAYRGHFQDQRLPEMLFRYQARNYPNSLNADDQIRWHQFLKHRLASPLAESRRAKLQQALTASPDNAILRDLAEFFQSSESFPIG